VKIIPDYPVHGPLRSCAHCGRPGAEAWFGEHLLSGRLCHPSAEEQPDCYRRVTVYGEPVGALLLLGDAPLPWGVEGILRLEGGRLVPPKAGGQ
jgi:hypothetical protein